MSSGSLVERVRRFTAPLIPRGSRVLAAVSGGCDSVALLWLLYELRQRLGIVRLGLVHVNHGLRGEESDADEAFVRELAASLGLACHGVLLSGKSADSAGIEAWARRERYAAFARLRGSEGYDMVATGHTADDQAETLVMRLMRGSGVRGLAGVRMQRADRVVRPLLTVRRSALVQYLAGKGYGYRNDSSNRDVRFLRNRVRHKVLPVLEHVYPGVVQWACTAAIAMQYVLDAIQPAVNNWISSNVFDVESGVAFRRDATVETALGQYALSESLRRNGIPLTRYHVRQVIKLRARTDGVVLLPAGWRAEAFRERVEVTRGTTREVSFSYPLSVPGCTCCDRRGRFWSEELAGGAVEVNRRRGDESSALLDRERLAMPLVYRSVRGDDRFEPLGAAGVRKLMPWLKKQGVARDRRREMGVVADANGKIVWIPGVRIAQWCRVTPRTRRILRLCYASPLLY